MWEIKGFSGFVIFFLGLLIFSRFLGLLIFFLCLLYYKINDKETEKNRPKPKSNQTDGFPITSVSFC